MDKKRICFIAQFPPPIHGLSKAVETAYNSKLKHEFLFEKVDISNNKKILKTLWSISRSNADLFYFTISQTKGGNLRDLFIFKLLQIQNKRCLIHLHGGYYRKLIENDMKNWQRKANYKAVSKLAGAIVLGKSLKPIFNGLLPDEKIHIVPNCIDNECLLSKEDFEKKLESSSKRRIKQVLYLSNFIHSKGYPEVLKMALFEKTRIASGQEKCLHFHFAGKFFEETEEKFFFNYIKENNLDELVTYHGVVIGLKKGELLKKCDIFTLPTRYPNEGQPISILEAMGNGLLVLTTDHAGIPDIVEDGVTGIIVKSDQDIQQKLEQILCVDTSLVVRRAFEMVNSKFNSRTYAENLGKLFRSV